MDGLGSDSFSAFNQIGNDDVSETSGGMQGPRSPAVAEIDSLAGLPSSIATGLNTGFHNGVNQSGDLPADSFSEAYERRGSAAERTIRPGKERFFCVHAAEEKSGLEVSCVSGFQESDALEEAQKGSVVEGGKRSTTSPPSPDFDGTQQILTEGLPKTKARSLPVEWIRVAESAAYGRSIELKGGPFNSKEIEGVVETHDQIAGPALKKSEVEQILRISPTCSLNLQVIDETALIQSPKVSQVGNGNGKEADCVSFAKDFKKNVNRNKEKKPRRRGKGAKKALEANGNQNLSAPNIESSSARSSRVYSRAQLEALRFIDTKGQKKMWNDVYSALSPVVAREYNGLASFTRQRDPHQRFTKKQEAPAILGGVSSRNAIEVENNDSVEKENVNAFDACGYEGEFIEDSDSDEEYSSILRPAFSVDGDPDFDSGPPEDGLEYLRRVRWEAAQIPKVNVAKFDRSSLNKEQTVYMPLIPEMAHCPDHLLPSKNWENAFLADFSDLRRALCDLQDATVDKLQSVFTFHEFRMLPEHMVPENVIDDVTEVDEGNKHVSPEPSAPEDEPSEDVIEDAGEVDETNEHVSPKPSASVDEPSLSVLLGMGLAARASMLRRRIGAMEALGSVLRNDCLWLFALCATVDVPLDADTCAALRCLLRKCAAMRAEKCDPDDEVVMLNILMTLSGTYFGQLGK